MQKRFWNWKDDDLTIDLSREYNGIMPPGLYAGFDRLVQPGMVLKLYHDLTGKTEVSKDKTITPKFGLIRTKQGITIRDDETIALNVAATGNAPRTDLIVCQHEYTEVVGGSAAVYIVIEGPPGGGIPGLTVPELQEIIGTLYLPANTASLTTPGVTYTRPEVPTISGNKDYVKRKGGQLLGELDANGQRIVKLPTPMIPQTDGDAVSWGTLKSLLRLLFPKQVIVAWNGAANAIPAPWKLADGSSPDAPDLRDKFIRGASTDKPWKTDGGSAKVTLSVGNLPKHTPQIAEAGSHTHNGTTADGGSHAHSTTVSSDGSHTHTGVAQTGGEHNHTGSGLPAGAHTHTGTTNYGGDHSHGYNTGSRDTDGWSGDSAKDDLGPQWANTSYAGGHSHTMNLNSVEDHSHVISINPGGSHTHNIAIEAGGSHNHSVTVAEGGTHKHAVTINEGGSHTHVMSEIGNDEAFDIIPPFYSLCYIYADVNTLFGTT